MHNLKSIRENPKLFKKKILERNVDLDLEELLDLDKKNREIIQKKEKLEQEKKIISKFINSSISIFVFRSLIFFLKESRFSLINFILCIIFRFLFFG